MEILNRLSKKGNVPFQARFFFFLYKNKLQKIMPPNKNLTEGQTVRSWSQAGGVQPIIFPQLETFGKCKISQNSFS